MTDGVRGDRAGYRDAGWRAKATVLAHVGRWMLEWIANLAHFAVFLVRRRRVKAEMETLIREADPNPGTRETERPGPTG
ncbi:MAG: hypothetical protein AAF488_16170 [Planctomycetota bacterium]